MFSSRVSADTPGDVMLVGLLAVLVLGAAFALASMETKGFEALDDIVHRGIEEQRYPGAVLVVAVGGKVHYRKAFGRYTYETSSPQVRLDTVFDMASVTKVIAGTPAALCLVEDGKLELDKPARSYWPEFGANGKAEITLRDLLTHVSGLKAYENYEIVERKRWPNEPAHDALYRHYASLPLSYTPRTKMVYSCLNLQCVAAVVQKVEGEPLEELLRRRVWGPLGMRDTTYRPMGRFLDRCAPTTVDGAGRPVRGRVHDPLAAYHGSDSWCPGNAGVFSTAGDLSRFAEMILNGGQRRGRRVFKQETVQLMTTAATPAGVAPRRTVGWGVYDEAPFVPLAEPGSRTEAIGHTGYTGTWLWIHPATRSYIIFLTNRVFPSPASGGEGASIDNIRAEIARIVTSHISER